MLIEAFFLLSYFENVYCKDEAVELLRHCTKAPSMKLASCHFEFLCQLQKLFEAASALSLCKIVMIVLDKMILRIIDM